VTAIGGGVAGVNRLVLQYYSDQTSEFNDFVAGKLDITDWAQPRGSFGAYDTNPDFTLSPLQGQYGLFGVYFNGASSVWKAWGCDWSNKTGTTYTSQCGIEMRQGFIHLVNRGDFANNNVASPSVGLADDSPQAKFPPGTPVATQCAWDQSIMVKYNTSCYAQWGGLQPGAYTITGSGSTCTPVAPTGTGPALLYQQCTPGLGFPVTGSPDFCAAAQHMINAGVATGMNPTTCVLTGVNAGVITRQFRFMVRSTNPRRTLGFGLTNEINTLFGASVVSVTVGTIDQIGPIVFNNEAGHVDDWEAYTFGYSEAGPYGGDALFGLYLSKFSAITGPCAGATGDVISTPNPTFLCNPKLDALLTTQSNSATLATYNTNTLAAMNLIGQLASDLVTYSPGLRVAALTSVGGLVNTRGVAYNSAQNPLNVHKNVAYTPVNPIYAFGGGDATTLRFGQASATTSENVFSASTVWEFTMLNEVYDTLFSANPDKPIQVFCWMCDTYTVSVDGVGNTHFLVQLRQNLRFHDGSAVDARDVAFSLLALRDLAPTAGGALSGLLKSVTVLSNTTLDIVFLGQSVLYPVDLEAFIIPRRLWQCDLVPQNDCAAGRSAVIAAGGNPTDYTNAGVNVPSAFRVSNGFDPIVNNALIGSGPFVCKSLFSPGVIGGGCVQNANGSQGGQAIPIGGRTVLVAFDNTATSSDPFNQYMRSYNPAWGTGTGIAAESGQFQEFSYADKGKTATVDIIDLGSVAACFGANATGTTACPVATYNYWHRAAFETIPGTISGEVSIVSSHLDDTYISPFAPWSSGTMENIIVYP
jgi:ABC-type transport system substrate-binding protein